MSLVTVYNTAHTYNATAGVEPFNASLIGSPVSREDIRTSIRIQLHNPPLYVLHCRIYACLKSSDLDYF